jgi:hypothetical protein
MPDADRATMSFDPTLLVIGLVLGSVGLGVFLYGKNTSSAKCILLGLAMMIVPYFITSVLIDCLFGAGCMLGLWLLPDMR